MGEVCSTCVCNCNSSRFKNNINNKIYLFNEEEPFFSLESFEIIKQIGKGAYSLIYLVKNKYNNTNYALKTIKKGFILENDKQQCILLEKQILESSKNPYIINYFGACENEENVYFLLEYFPQGDLFAYIRKNKRIPEQQTKYIISEVITGIEYLHENLKIMYRDLKPENILLTCDGHIKLTDFGLSKKCHRRSYSFLGTTEYLAPEIFLSTGYDESVDWWSLGVLIYEMIAGKSPFLYQKDSEISEIKKNVLENIPKFNKNFSQEAKNLITQLLEKNISKRLGTKGCEEIKIHKFFDEIVWKDVYVKKSKACIY